MGLKKKGKKSKAEATDPRPKGSSREQLVLDIVRTDNSFYVGYTDPSIHVGKCIHCGTMLTVTMSGRTEATIEHIMPLTAGGSGTDLHNLALACERCNNTKGIHHDAKNLDERAQEVIAALLEKRHSRWREPA
jgi:5-methylcytosine-specific restriction endonuclease McrA